MVLIEQSEVCHRHLDYCLFIILVAYNICINVVNDLKNNKQLYMWLALKADIHGSTSCRLIACNSNEYA